MADSEGRGQSKQTGSINHAADEGDGKLHEIARVKDEGKDLTKEEKQRLRKEKKQQKKGKKDDKGPTEKGTDKEKKVPPSTASQPVTQSPAQKAQSAVPVVASVPVSESTTPTDKPTKSKAELKAERRARQEAERASKQAKKEPGSQPASSKSKAPPNELQPAVKRLPEHIQVDDPAVVRKLAKKLERQQKSGQGTSINMSRVKVWVYTVSAVEVFV